MHPARIRRLSKIASALEEAKEYEASFALRCIAYEGLLRRASIKALWMRGAAVKNAEEVIAKLDKDPINLLADCCGLFIEAKNELKFPVLARIKNRIAYRNLYFHQLSVSKKEQLHLLSKLLGATLARPTVAFRNVSVSISANSLEPLGDPLSDLRKAKRKAHIKKKGIFEIVPQFEKEQLEFPIIREMTESEVEQVLNPAIFTRSSSIVDLKAETDRRRNSKTPNGAAPNTLSYGGAPTRSNKYSCAIRCPKRSSFCEIIGP